MKAIQSFFFIMLFLVASSFVHSEQQTIYWAIDSICCYEGEYTGELKDGIPHGQGTHVHMWTTQTYIGHWKDGRRCGNGSFYEYGPGNVKYLQYEGEWKEDMRHGEGTSYDFQGNAVFSGRWVNDSPES